MRSVTVVTHIVTPYQAELFDAVRRAGTLDLRVVYLADSRPHRDWHHPPLNHPAIEMAHASPPDSKEARAWMRHSDLVVFGHYRDGQALAWIDMRSRARTPWCFWGERPGFRFEGLVGRAFRAWKLRSLLAAAAPIWGIGNWAVEGWRREFGTARRYFNVPYFSNLERFARASGDCGPTANRRVLFSGSLIGRKGIDLLASVFGELAASRPFLTLDIVGSGPLQRALQRKLSPLGGRVVFHGFKQWSQLPDFYRNADVLCVPSRYDGWGLVVPEGLASGLPVITTDRTGAAIDLVKPGQNGWIAKAGDRQSLLDALAGAADMSTATLEAMSRAATTSVASHQLADGVRRFEAAVHGSLAAWQRPEERDVASPQGAVDGSRLEP